MAHVVTIAHMPQGLELKLERVAAQVQVQQIARAMGLTDGRISKIERADRLDPKTVARYRAALATCATSREAA